MKLLNRKIILQLVLLLITSTSIQAQHKKSNWLQDKKEHTGRWRVGSGIDILEPTGFDIQFYRLSKICTSDFSITKKISIGAWLGYEGLISKKLLEEQNNVELGKDNFRYGLDLKFYLPIFLNPYIGIGAEGGTRTVDGTKKFYPDAILRIGLEQKVLGIKLSTKSSLNITIFIDGKFNKCLTSNYKYIMPGGGIRFHLL